jgi:hypothetical protein
MSEATRTLGERVEKLERQNRMMKFAILGMGLLVCGLGLVGAAGSSQEELKVKSLMVLSPDGQLAVKVHAPDGTGSIDLWDTSLKSGQPQISIGCIPLSRGGGTQIFMNNRNGGPGVNILAQEKGGVHTWRGPIWPDDLSADEVGAPVRAQARRRGSRAEPRGVQAARSAGQVAAPSRTFRCLSAKSHPRYSAQRWQQPYAKCCAELRRGISRISLPQRLQLKSHAIVAGRQR